MHGPFASIEDAQAAVDAWRKEYNTTRPHQSLAMGFPSARFALAAPDDLGLRIPVELTRPARPVQPDDGAAGTSAACRQLILSLLAGRRWSWTAWCRRRIEHDLMVTAGRTTRCRVTGPDENGGYWAGDGPMALFTSGQDAEAFLTDLADQLSEAICEDLADGGQAELARTWPPCPLHQHSLDPALVDGQATWRCRDGAYKVRIGSFPAS